MASVLFYGCKKKEESPKEEIQPPVTTLPGFNDVYGMIQASYVINDFSNTTAIDSTVSIGFYESPSKTTAYVDAGTVTVNGVSLTSTSFGYQNYGTERVNLHNILNWSVSGSPTSTVVPFTYAHLPIMPQYSGHGLLPDTSVKANGISLNISGLSKFNVASLYLMQDAQNSFKMITGNGTVVFSAQELAAFKTTAPVLLMLSASNLSTVKIGEVPYNILYSTVFNKSIVLQ